MLKVVFVTNIPAYYRVKFFEELGKFVDLTVIFEEYNYSSKKGYLPSEFANFRAIYLKSIKIAGYNFAFGLNKILKKHDVVIFGIIESYSNMLAMALMNIKKNKYILNIDGFFNKKRNIIKRFAYKHFISHSPVLLTAPQNGVESLQEISQKENLNVYTFPFASYYENEMQKEPLTLENKCIYKQKLNLDVNHNYFVCVAQFIERKNIHGLLDAWKIANLGEHVELLLIGDGEQKKSINEIIKRQNLNARIVDFISPNDVPYYYKASLCSILNTNEDVWGLVVSESLCSGVPVISTDMCYAALDMIKNGLNGYIVKHCDSNMLAEKIKDIYEQVLCRCEKLSNNAMKSAEDYSIENMVKVHLDILKKEGYVW